MGMLAEQEWNPELTNARKPLGDCIWVLPPMPAPTSDPNITCVCVSEGAPIAHSQQLLKFATLHSAQTARMETPLN
eukprot:9540970-Alexandrium_andersonii.AAC.1